MAQPFVLDVNLRIKDIIGLEKVKSALAQTGGSVGVGGGKGGAKSGGGGGAVPGGAAGGLMLPPGAGQKTAAEYLAVEKAALKTAKASERAAKAARKTSTEMKAAGGSAKGFGDSMKLAGVRYAAFVVATTAPFAIIAGFKKAAESVIEFDEALIKISQVLGKTKADMADLGQTMIRLSTQTGTSLEEIAKSAKVLTQAGYRDNIEEMLEPLSKIPLLASFESIEQATEGVIATTNQFTDSAGSATDILDRFDYVSNKFAITASDLVEGVKRGGGAFSALGGNINEFIALMTTMRSVTRESAQTIGTSIRTITARMARPRTIKFLEGLGVVVRDAEGELLGIIDILSNLNEVFKASGTEGKAAIAEQLGGFRQISRVLAAIQNPEKIQAALQASKEAAGSIARNAEKGLGSLSAQLGILGARWTEFVQSMAEPLFIPLIQSATGFLNVMVTTLSVMGPILPLLTTIVGFAAGVAALAKSFSLVASAAGLASKAFGIAGAAGAGMLNKGLGIAGLGGAAGQRATQVQQLKQQANLGLGGAAAGGAAAGASKFGQMPQLIGAGLVYTAFKSLSESALEAENSFGFISAEVIKAAAAFTIAASLLSKQSIGSMAKGFGGYMAGGYAAGGAAGMGAMALGAGAVGGGLLVAGSMAVAKQKQINIDKLVKKAAEYINELDLKVTDTESLNEAGGQIGDKLFKTVQEASKEYDGFGGQIAEFGERMGRFLSSMGSLIGVSEADWSGIYGAIIDEEAIKEMMGKMYAESPDVFKGMLDQAIDDAGPNFRDALTQSFASQLPDGANPATAELMRKWMIELTGGEKSAMRKVAQSRLLKEQQKMATESSRIARQLSQTIIPSKIFSQMDLFSKAVSDTTSSILTSINSFKALSGSAGQISAPQIPTEFTTEAAQKGLETYGFEAMMEGMGLDGSSVQALGKASETYFQAGKMASQLIRDLSATEAMVREQSPTLSPEGRLELPEVKQQASKAMEDALSSFFANVKMPDKYKGEIQQVMREVGEQWRDSIVQGIQPDTKKIEAALNRVMSVFEKPAVSMAENMGQMMSTLLQQVQAQINNQAQRTQAWSSGSEGTQSHAENFNRAMEAIGADTIPIFDDMTETAARFANYDDRIVSLSTAISELEKKRTKTFGELTEAHKKGDPAALGLAKTFLGLNDTMNTLQSGVASSIVLAGKSREAWQERTQEKIADINERASDGGYDATRGVEQETRKMEDIDTKLSRITEYLQRETVVAQLDAVADSSGIYKQASTIFSGAVDKFNTGINDLSRALRPDEVGAGPGQQIDINTGEVTDIEPPPTTVQEAALDAQALGDDSAKVLEAFSQEIDNGKTSMQNLNDGIILLRSGLASSLSLLTGYRDELSKESIDWAKSMVTQRGDISDSQLRSAAEKIAASQTERVEAGEMSGGTGAALNTEDYRIENIFQYMKAIRDGTEIDRSLFKVSDLSQRQLDLLTTETQAMHKTIKDQEPITPSDAKEADNELKKALEAGERYKKEKGIDSLIGDAGAGGTDQVAMGGTLPPPFTGIGKAIAAAVIGAIPLEPDAGGEPAGAEQRNTAASMLEAAGEAANVKSDALAAGAENVQIGGGDILMAAETLRSSVEAISMIPGGLLGDDMMTPDLNTAAAAQNDITNLDTGIDSQMATSDIRMSAENLRAVSDTFGEATNRFAASNEGVMMANETFRLGADNFRMNVDSMRASTDIMRGVADTMQAVVDIQSQTQIDPGAGGVAEGESEAGMQQVSSAIDSLGERVDSITEAVNTQTQQEAEFAAAEREKPLEVAGLEDNTEAIATNNEIIDKSQENMGNLNEGMTKVAGAMEEGIGIDIETMSDIKVDVAGVGAAAKEFTAEFEAVATRVAKAEINAVLQQLARSAGSSEAANAFESALT